MEIIQRIINDCIIIDINGALDFYNHTSLYDTISAPTNSGNTKIIINMKNVHYIDSTGIGSLVALVKMAKNQSIDLRFADLQETVKHRLKLSKLFSYLPIAETVEDALIELK